jgi:hypothetical protein
MHEPGWGCEPVQHFEQYVRDMREDWIRPDDWTEEDETNYPNPAHPMPYGPPNRTRGRSFAQDRRAPPEPSASRYNYPPAVQPSPRGPGHPPLDNASHRHSQHDWRFSGPGYSGDGWSFIPNNAPRRQFRGSFNDTNHLRSRGAKLVPRDQLLVANISIKVKDTDGHSATTPTQRLHPLVQFLLRKVHRLGRGLGLILLQLKLRPVDRLRLLVRLLLILRLPLPSPFQRTSPSLR